MKNNKISTSRHNAIFRSILWLRIFSNYKVIAWSSIFFVTVFNLIAIILEALSFSIFIPIIEYIKSKSTAGEFAPVSKVSQLINDLFIYFNIEVTLIGLSTLLVLLVCFNQFLLKFRIGFEMFQIGNLRKKNEESDFRKVMNLKILKICQFCKN